jgi:putative FmdB family regulatory protein
MPLYEYNCDNCSYKFDKLVTSHNSSVECPLCRGKVEKLMSTFSVGHQGTFSGDLPPGVGPKMCSNC